MNYLGFYFIVNLKQKSKKFGLVCHLPVLLCVSGNLEYSLLYMDIIISHELHFDYRCLFSLL